MGDRVRKRKGGLTLVFISRISVSVTELFVDSIIMQVSLHLKKSQSIATKQSLFYRDKIQWLHTIKSLSCIESTSAMWCLLVDEAEEVGI